MATEVEPPPRELHEVTGSFGPWQRAIFVVFFYINVVGIWQNLAITFLAPNMDFRCSSPYDSGNYSSGSGGNGSADARCWAYEKDDVENRTACTAWEYDTSVFSETIVSEWDLVCDRGWLVSLAKSVYMVGFLLSVLFFGQLSDCVGRYPTVVVSYVITLASMILSLFSTSYLMFVVLRFFQAFGRTGLTTVGIVLVMELVGPQHSTQVGIGIQLGWSLGFVSLALLAYFVRHWFWLQVAMSIPILPLVFVYRIIPESPRWLLMQGKVEKLEETLKKATKMNKKELKCDVKDLEILQEHLQKEDNKKTSTVLDLFKTPKMRNRTFNMIYLWVVNSFMYYGLSFNTNELAGDPYLNFFLAGVIEFPSYALLYVSIRQFGRRPTLVTLMMVGGCSCVAGLLPVSPGVLTGLAMSGKFCVTASFGLLYLYTSELFPTVVRNVALGSCSCAARVGSILAPFVRELGKATHPSVPNLMYFLLAVSSGLLALLLPETRGRSLPDSLQEGEDYDRNSATKNNGQVVPSST